MKKRNCSITAILLITGLLVILMIGVLVAYFYGKTRMVEKRILAQPPMVLVHSPKSGDVVAEDNPTPVLVTATGRNAIARVELWLDGEKLQEQVPEMDLKGGMTTFPAVFTVRVSEGYHTLYLRAVDNSGLVGQSLPVDIIGTEPLGGRETTTIDAEEGQTLQEIAESMGGEGAALHKLNPGLGSGGLPAGTSVTIPKPSPQGGGQVQFPPPTNQGQAVAGQGAPAANPAGTRMLKLAYPFIDIGPFISLVLTGVPAAPTQLEYGFENCIVQLKWYDNSVDEQNFRVWMQRIGGPPQLIATLPGSPRTGQVSYRFPSPALGMYSFWVEAVNALGAQPGNMVGVAINDISCPEGVATKLEIEALVFQVSTKADRAYCYLSIEGATARRIPEGNEYINIQKSPTGDTSDVTSKWGGEKKVIIPIPADEEVTLEGECLGLSDTIPFALGSFRQSVPKEQWDGSQLVIDSGSLYIIYRVRPLGPSQAPGLYSLTDYQLQPPRIVSVTAANSDDPAERARLARKVTVQWAWEGDVKELKGFTVALDGQETVTVGDRYRTADIILPSSCGGRYQFTVAAVVQDARSVHSNIWDYAQPICEMYAEIAFGTFMLTGHDDYEPGSCDEAELNFWVIAGDAGGWFGDGPSGYGYGTKCNQAYHFTQYPMWQSPDGSQDVFTTPVDPGTSTVLINLQFWDFDNCIFPVGGKDTICNYARWITVDPYEDWASYEEDVSATCQDPDHLTGQRLGTIKFQYRVRGYRSPEVP